MVEDERKYCVRQAGMKQRLGGIPAGKYHRWTQHTDDGVYTVSDLEKHHPLPAQFCNYIPVIRSGENAHSVMSPAGAPPSLLHLPQSTHFPLPWKPLGATTRTADSEKKIFRR